MDKSDYLDWVERGGNAEVPSVPLCVVLLTYKRTSLAVRTVRGVCEFLEYPHSQITWYVADDGSPREHMDVIMEELNAYQQVVTGYHNEKFYPDTTFCGMGWNTALVKAHQVAPILLWLEDDWELKTPFDIRPFVRLLLERPDVGLVRMGTLAAGNDCRTVGHNGIHYLEYLRSSSYAYSGNPLLRHIRFAERYGYFIVNGNPGEIELAYDRKFREDPGGPNIWRPVDIGGWGVWGHIGAEKTF